MANQRLTVKEIHRRVFSSMTPKVNNPPERIFLVVGDIEEDCDFGSCREVTWCTERMYDADIEYRRVKTKSRRPPGKRESTP